MREYKGMPMLPAKCVSLSAPILIIIAASYILLTSCSTQYNPQIPNQTTDTEYIEGNSGNQPKEGTDDEINKEGLSDGENSIEGEGSHNGEPSEGEGEENSFTSASIFDFRNVDYETPLPTTDEQEGSSERELIEPDVIRKWENYLLVLNQFRGLTIVDLNEKKVLSNLPIYGYPRDLYIRDHYAIVLIGYTVSHFIENDVIQKITGAKAIIVDISNLNNPQIISSIFLPGDFVDSRIVGQILYAVTSDYYYQYISDTETFTSSDSTWTIESGSKCWITSIDLTNPSSPKVVDETDFPGFGTIIQATNHSIYVCIPDWNTENTSIIYIDISSSEGNLIQYPPIEVTGYISDKFKLDEWQNYLRVVSYSSWQSRNTYISIFDVSNPTNITLCSKTLLPEAQGETLYATRFAENYLYLVTYLTIDPLFVLDLSNPNQPEVKGSLHIPGWSVYIEPMDNHQLIALGVDDQENQRRVKVSWFDVSDPSNPTEVSTVSIGEGWTWSSAYSDVKAFTILDNYIIVPFTGWIENRYTEQLQFIKWQKEKNQLQPLGAVTLQGQALRTIKYTDYFYSITTEYIHEITLSNEEQPVLTGVDIPLAEYVADVIEVNNAKNIVEMISNTEKKLLIAKLKNNENKLLNTLTIKTDGYFLDAEKITEEKIGIVLNEWRIGANYESYFRTVLININTSENTSDDYIPKLEVLRDEILPLTPLYYGNYFYYDIYPVRPLPYPHYWYYSNYVPNEFIFSTNNKLIVRGRAQNFDITLGDETPPSEGFAIVDISPDTKTYTVGLGLTNIVNLVESSGRIFLTTQKFIESKEPPLTSYYLSEISLNPPNISQPINIPGVIASFSPSTDIYFLKDWQYTNLEGPHTEYYYPQYETWFRTIKIDNGKVNIIDSVNTKLSWAQFYNEISDYLLYLETENNLLTIHKYNISPQGNFVNYSKKSLGASLWGDILYCTKPYVYLTIDSASIVILNLNEEEFSLQFSALIPLNSYPIKYRIGKENLYIISGYGGWSKINIQPD